MLKIKCQGSVSQLNANLWVELDKEVNVEKGHKTEANGRILLALCLYFVLN